MHDIFISYSRRDSDIVMRFIEGFQREGFSVWYDKDGIETGDTFKKVIVKAIEQARIVVFFSSQASNASEWTAKEIGIANARKKHIIPVKLDHSLYNPDVEFDIINLNFVDYTQLQSSALPELCDGIRNKLAALRAQEQAAKRDIEKEMRLKLSLDMLQSQIDKLQEEKSGIVRQMKEIGMEVAEEQPAPAPANEAECKELREKLQRIEDELKKKEQECADRKAKYDNARHELNTAQQKLGDAQRENKQLDEQLTKIKKDSADAFVCQERYLEMQRRIVMEKAEELMQRGDSDTASLVAMELLEREPRMEQLLRKVYGGINNNIDVSKIRCQVLEGHNDEVNSVVFSPDGKRIVSASDDNTLRLWDAATGKPIGEPLTGHTSPIYSAAFSPDGKRILSASADKTLRLWDAATGKPIGEPLKGHTDWVRFAIFSPDGKRIVSASDDKTLRLWDAATGKPIGEPLTGHTSGVHSAVFSPDSKRIVSASDDWTLRLWDAATGKPIGEPLTGHTDWVRSAAFSPDGKRIVSASDDTTLRLWDAATGKPIREPLKGHFDLVFSAAFSPDGKRIVSASGDNTLRLWNVATGKPIGDPLKGHTNTVCSAVFSPDGKHIVSASADNTLRLWELPLVDDQRPLPELIADIRKRLGGRQLTQEERTKYYLD